MDKELKVYIDEKTKDIKESIIVALVSVLFTVILTYALIMCAL